MQRDIFGYLLTLFFVCWKHPTQPHHTSQIEERPSLGVSRTRKYIFVSVSTLTQVYDLWQVYGLWRICCFQEN